MSPVFLFFPQTGERSGQVEKSKKNARQRQNDFKVNSISTASLTTLFKMIAIHRSFHDLELCFHRKWLRRWPIGWWSSFEGLFSRLHCHRLSWVFTVAGRTSQILLEPGWHRLYTSSGTHTLFQYITLPCQNFAFTMCYRLCDVLQMIISTHHPGSNSFRLILSKKIFLLAWWAFNFFAPHCKSFLNYTEATLDWRQSQCSFAHII